MTALIVIAVIWALGTLITFGVGVLGWAYERDIDPEEATHYAKLALNSWAWPILALTQLRALIQDARK